MSAVTEHERKVFYGCACVNSADSFLKLYFCIQKSVNVWIHKEYWWLRLPFYRYDDVLPAFDHVTIPDPMKTIHIGRATGQCQWLWKYESLVSIYVVYNFYLWHSLFKKDISMIQICICMAAMLKTTDLCKIMRTYATSFEMYFLK